MKLAVSGETERVGVLPVPAADPCSSRRDLPVGAAVADGAGVALGCVCFISELVRNISTFGTDLCALETRK